MSGTLIYRGNLVHRRPGMLQHSWWLNLVFYDSSELVVVSVSRPRHFNQRIKEVRVSKQLPFVFDGFLELDAGSLTEGQS